MLPFEGHARWHLLPPRLGKMPLDLKLPVKSRIETAVAGFPKNEIGNPFLEYRDHFLHISI
jgi:hypothetical protein